MIQSNDIIIEEFENNGYINPYRDSNTIKKLRRNYAEYFKIFDTAVFRYHGRCPRYSADEIFGERLLYYYDVRREKEFVDCIVKRFYDKNPFPNREMRAAFTRIMHYHGLCWFGCYHGGKKVYTKLRRQVEYEETDEKVQKAQ